MTSSAVEATVESCAAEASALGFTHAPGTTALRVRPLPNPRSALTLRLAHESAEDAVSTSTSSLSSTACRSSARVARDGPSDVEAGAKGGARRFAVHVLQPLCR